MALGLTVWPDFEIARDDEGHRLRAAEAAQQSALGLIAVRSGGMPLAPRCRPSGCAARPRAHLRLVSGLWGVNSAAFCATLLGC